MLSATNDLEAGKAYLHTQNHLRWHESSWRAGTIFLFIGMSLTHIFQVKSRSLRTKNLHPRKRFYEKVHHNLVVYFSFRV